MSHIPAGQFKATCLQLMDSVLEKGVSYTITKHGKPVAQLVPVQAPVKSLNGLFAGQGEILGDIISPVDVRWDALK